MLYYCVLYIKWLIIILYHALRAFYQFSIILSRYFGILIIDDNEKAWFPAADLKEFHGIMPHEVTVAETLLFCIRSDGSEGFCCPTGGPSDDEDEDLT